MKKKYVLACLMSILVGTFSIGLSAQEKPTLVVEAECGTIHIFTDSAFPRGLRLADRRNHLVLGGDQTGVILARLFPKEKTDVTYAWLNIVTGEDHTRPTRNRSGTIVGFPQIDPLPGKTIYGRADFLPYYWDYGDTNPRRRGVQGFEGFESDLRFKDAAPDGVPEFLDGPADRKRAVLRFATFLVIRPQETGDAKLRVLAGFRWTFNEGSARKGFNNGDETVTDLTQVTLDDTALELINTALQNSGYGKWSVGESN